MVHVPHLPNGDQVPTHGAVADLLIQSLPEAERQTGRALLLEKVLPTELSALPRHPQPRRLAEEVYQSLADELNAAPPAGRLRVLQAAAFRADIREQAGAAAGLAIARYLHDHPEDAGAADDWMTPLVADWRTRAPAELAAEATRRLQRLEIWERQVRTPSPEIWNAHRMDFIYAKLALQAARSGSFDTAGGTLYDFLKRAGVPVKELDIH